MAETVEFAGKTFQKEVFYENPRGLIYVVTGIYNKGGPDEEMLADASVLDHVHISSREAQTLIPVENPAGLIKHLKEKAEWLEKKQKELNNKYRRLDVVMGHLAKGTETEPKSTKKVLGMDVY